MEREMEGIDTEMVTCVKMDTDNTVKSEGQPMVKKNKKMKYKRKKRGQNKKLGIKFQIKKGEPASLNLNRKWDAIKNPAEKRKELEEPGEESNTAQNKNSDQEKKAKKKRNHRDFAVSSTKVSKSILSALTLCLMNIFILMCGRMNLCTEGCFHSHSCWS